MRNALLYVALLISFPALAAEQVDAKLNEPYKICSIEDKTFTPVERRIDLEHGGGLNACGCHVNRKTGECHCHRQRACGCSCQPYTCK
jgi:hypothetical protein